MSDKPRYVHEGILMQVIGNHPHAGDYGHPVGESENSITEVMGMYEIEFVNGMCEHGTRGCFAKKQNLRMVKKGR